MDRYLVGSRIRRPFDDPAFRAKHERALAALTGGRAMSSSGGCYPVAETQSLASLAAEHDKLSAKLKQLKAAANGRKYLDRINALMRHGMSRAAAVCQASREFPECRTAFLRSTNRLSAFKQLTAKPQTICR